MKNLLLLLFFFAFSFSLSAQQFLSGSIEHDELTRDYLVYVPASYTGDEAVPLVFNFHGYGSNASEQQFYSGLFTVAAENNFLLVHPQGTPLVGTDLSHFNVGGWTIESTVDDVGFTSALLDTLIANYNIDTDRVYSTGMSNGGYMSFLLACQLSDRIAAVASVTGSMTTETYDACNPQHPTPVLQIHGTMDGTVPYNGDFWTKSIDDVVAYWVNYNNCTNSTMTDVPDVDMTDESTVQHFVNDGGDLSANVEHFKIIGGGHTWPSAAFDFDVTNYDINASQEIWDFFSRYDLNGPISTTTTQIEEKSLRIYPNPTTSFVQLEGNVNFGEPYAVYALSGKLMQEGILQITQINLSDLPKGMYFLSINQVTYKVSKID